jgi:hypothetical protein
VVLLSLRRATGLSDTEEPMSLSAGLYSWARLACHAGRPAATSTPPRSAPSPPAIIVPTTTRRTSEAVARCKMARLRGARDEENGTLETMDGMSSWLRAVLFAFLHFFSKKIHI